jgi:hypothetical protein
MTSLPIDRVAAEIRANTTLASLPQLILTTVLAASKVAANSKPSRKHDTPGNIATCKRRANCFNPKEICARTREGPLRRPVFDLRQVPNYLKVKRTAQRRGVNLATGLAWAIEPPGRYDLHDDP